LAFVIQILYWLQFQLVIKLKLSIFFNIYSLYTYILIV